MELATCSHPTEYKLGSFQDEKHVRCTNCGQKRRYKEGDAYSIVITQLGRIGDAIVMPPPATSLDITPAESRLVKDGWDILQGQGSSVQTTRAEQLAEESHLDERAAKLGRPPTGETLQCVDCGKDIYVRKYRLDANPEVEHRCRECASRHAAKAQRKKTTEKEEPVPEPPAEVAEEPEPKEEVAVVPTKRQYYDEHREEIFADYQKMSMRDVEHKWKMGRSYMYWLIKQWRKLDYTIPTAYADTDHTEVSEKRRPRTLHQDAYWKRHREEIIKDYHSMTVKALFAKWSLSSSTWTRIKKLLDIPMKTPPSEQATDPKVKPTFRTLPPFNNIWSPAVQIAWFETYLELAKLEKEGGNETG